MDNLCCAGCVVFDGGEKKHHVDCVYYPESRTKMYDDAIEEIRLLRRAMTVCANNADDWRLVVNTSVAALGAGNNHENKEQSQ